MLLLLPKQASQPAPAALLRLCGNAPPLGALEVDHGAGDVVGRVALEGHPNKKLSNLGEG